MRERPADRAVEFAVLLGLLCVEPFGSGENTGCRSSADGRYGEVAKGEEIVVIESTKATSGITAPFDGVITEINQTVADSPETVNEDPTGSWFFRIQPSDPSALDEYLDEDEYKALIG